jgi:hypothetical protein
MNPGRECSFQSKLDLSTEGFDLSCSNVFRMSSEGITQQFDTY